MIRSVANATISFGLVSIPVKFYTAVSPSTGPAFNLLHKKCGGRLQQQYFCKGDNEVVPRTEMLKGYEFAKDQYVMFSDEELDALEEPSIQAVAITEFVPIDEVPPIFFEKSYYLGPNKGGERSYVLLAEAMRKTERAAIAMYAARGKQHLVMVSPVEGAGLILHQLHYADEVRPFSEVPIGTAEIGEAELHLAIQLVEQIASDSFNPEKYADEVKKRIEEAITRKIEGKDIPTVPAATKAKVLDLMEALTASVRNALPPAPPRAARRSQKKEKEKKVSARSRSKRATLGH